jgi:D-alanyl-D-alanine carboxypeptidase (penicillin-binding protein 5/6)
MALISRAAYLHPEIAKIVGTGQYTINPTNVHAEPTYLINHHEMLLGYRTYRYRYEFCKGGKTGYTKAAHFTLVTYAEKDGKRLLCIILNEPTKNMQFTETTNLFEYYFANIEEHDASEVFDITAASEKKKIGKSRKSENLSMEASKIVLPIGASVNDVKYKYKSQKKVDTKTGAIGTVKFEYNKKTIGQAEIYDKSEIKKTTQKAGNQKTVSTKKVKKANYGGIWYVLIAFLIIIAVLLLVRKRILDKKRHNREDALWNAWKNGKKKWR